MTSRRCSEIVLEGRRNDRIVRGPLNDPDFVVALVVATLDEDESMSDTSICWSRVGVLGY